MKNNNEIKSFLTGLGIGSILAGLGVFLVDPKNRENVKEKAEAVKDEFNKILGKIKKAIKEAKSQGKNDLIKELKNAEKTLRKLEKRIE